MGVKVQYCIVDQGRTNEALRYQAVIIGFNSEANGRTKEEALQKSIQKVRDHLKNGNGEIGEIEI